MPHDKIKSYIPFNDGQKALYVSETGDSLDLIFDHYQFVYDNTFCDNIPPGSEAIPYESVSLSIMFSNRNEKVSGYMGLRVRQRVVLETWFKFKDADVSGDSDGISAKFWKELENDDSQDQGADCPRYPNEFMDYLTDTIVLTNGYNEAETYALLVAGRGIVWFVGDNGVKWYLQD